MTLRTLVLVILTCTGICACKKSKPEMVFDITGIPDVKIRYTEAQVIPLSAIYVSGPKHHLTLTAEGLPEGASITFKPNVKQPPFDLNVHLNTENVKGGDYVVKVMAKPSHGATRSFDMKLHVAGVEEIGCAMEIAGEYSGPPLPAIKMTKPTIATAITKNQVTFINCDPAFYANLDCNSHTLDIPHQKLQSGDFVWGTGSWTLSGVNININIEYVATGTKNYNFILKKPSTLE